MKSSKEGVKPNARDTLSTEPPLPTLPSLLIFISSKFIPLPFWEICVVSRISVDMFCSDCVLLRGLVVIFVEVMVVFLVSILLLLEVFVFIEILFTLFILFALFVLFVLLFSTSFVSLLSFETSSVVVEVIVVFEEEGGVEGGEEEKGVGIFVEGEEERGAGIFEKEGGVVAEGEGIDDEEEEGIEIDEEGGVGVAGTRGEAGEASLDASNFSPRFVRLRTGILELFVFSKFLLCGDIGAVLPPSS